jgi:D-alanyl-D-alanine carboxypeptidase (penicillin-binding protein 5/6)
MNRFLSFCRSTLAALTLGLALSPMAQAQLPQAPELAAKHYLLLDLTTNQVLSERAADTSADPASLTK